MENEAYYARERRKIEKELVEYHVYGKKATPKNWAKDLDLTGCICYTQCILKEKVFEYRNWVLPIWIIDRVYNCNGSYVVLGDKVFEKNDIELEIWKW